MTKTNNSSLVKRYLNFIDGCVLKNKKVSPTYMENHHICPKAKGMFPEYRRNKTNIVRLTARQHYIAHVFLFRIFRNKPTAYALRSMCNGQSNQYQFRSKSKLYEKIRLEMSTVIGHQNKGMAAYKDAEGNLHHTRTDDARVLSGELVSLTKGRSGGKRSEEWKKEHSGKAAAGKLKVCCLGCRIVMAKQNIQRHYGTKSCIDNLLSLGTAS